MNTFIIDGYNLLFKLLDQTSLSFSQARLNLIHEINHYCHQKKIACTLVFDAYSTYGPPVKTHYDTIEILYSAEDQTADALILRLVQVNPKPQSLIIVTSDKRLGNQVKSLGAKTESIRTFYKKIEKGFLQNEAVSEKKIGFTEQENQRWLEIFEKGDGA